MAWTTLTKDETGAASAEIDAPIVFVGYGVDAPEYTVERLQRGVDVKGKVVLVIVGDPALERREVFHGQGADLLRPLGVQV